MGAEARSEVVAVDAGKRLRGARFALPSQTRGSYSAAWTNLGPSFVSGLFGIVRDNAWLIMGDIQI